MENSIFSKQETHSEAEKNSKVIQALSRAIQELKRARFEIGDITPDSPYIWTELAYILVNSYRGLEGFIKARLNTEAKQMENVFESNKNT